jgi:DME family drug/metabolite transporter
LSGILGMGVADCFYIKSLSIIGTRETLLLESLIPVITFLLGYIFYGNTINLTQILAMLLTVSGIFTVIS